MKSKVRIGVIGAGRIGSVHAETLVQRVPTATVEMISDVKLDAAKAVAQNLGIPHAVTDYREVLKSSEIDAVLVCSSTDTHAEIVENAAAAKKHVFCEKPLDLNLERTRQTLQKVEKSGVHLQLGFNRRFDPSFAKIAELVRTGELGVPQLIRISSRDPSPPSLEYIARSGGIFLDMTIHDFDMARYLVADEIEEIYASGSVLVDPRIGGQGDIDTAVVTIRYVTGALCTIDNSRRAAYGYDQRVEVFGSKATALAANSSPTQVQVWGEAGLVSEKPHHFFMTRYSEAYARELSHFVSCVLSGKTPEVGGSDGLMALAMGLTAKRSWQENRPVKLKEILEK